ncbi:DUF1775 domain-containing protein [Actinoplanes sp. TBRC 11911]|nr:DUF1775 domain-containing protein [Actinoplanes sp. TBRC 11911]
MLAAAAGGVAAATLATPAWAHVEVAADKPQAGARDVTLTFTGEAESDSGGIASERVVLPAGMTPSDVRLKKAPKGWKLTPGSDGFTVAGPALKIGEDAVWAVTVAQLPTNSTTLSFKTLETYSDGQISRWIEIPQDGQPEPDNPAPTLKVKAAAAPATSSPAPSPAVSSAPPTAASSAPAAAQDLADDSSGSGGTGLWVTVGIVAAIAVAAVALLMVRQRRGRP